MAVLVDDVAKIYQKVLIEHKGERKPLVYLLQFVGTWKTGYILCSDLENCLKAENESLYKALYRIPEHEERLHFLVQQVERMTGLQKFGIYMNKLLTIDALFLNEDRHTHNIAVLMNGKGDYAYCPIFDNGAGLLADATMDYPLSGDVYRLMDNVQSKTICSEFDEQLDISEALYKTNLKFNFTKKDVTELLKNAEVYPKEIRNRVETIIFAQMRKYSYLFSSV